MARSIKKGPFVDGHLMQKVEGMTLNGVMDRIRVPFLVTHGANDRQISVDYAQQSYDQLVNSPDRRLKIFTDREGGVEHAGTRARRGSDHFGRLDLR